MLGNVRTPLILPLFLTINFHIAVQLINFDRAIANTKRDGYPHLSVKLH